MASANVMLQQNRLFQTYIQQQNVAIANTTTVFQQINNINQAQTKLNKTMEDSTKKANAFMGIFNGPALGKIAKAGSALLGGMLQKGADQQSVLDSMSLRAGSQGAGQAIFDQTAAQALKYGQDVKTALAGTQGFMASTTDPAQLEQLNMLAMRMSQLNPGKGLKGATDALSKLMTGDSKSLGADYNMKAGDQAALTTAANAGDINGMIAAMDTLLNKQGVTQAAFDTMLDSPAVKWKSVVDGFNLQLSSLGQDGMNALTPAIDALLSMLNSEAFSQFISGVGAAFSFVGSLLGEAMAGVASFIGSLTTDGSSTNMLLIGMGVALAALGVILWAMVAPVVAQAIAWLGVYWPILLVVAVIGLIIGALIKFGVSAEAIVGFVVGLFYGLYAAIYNYVAMFYNLAMGVAEFLINLFTNPMYVIKKLIYDLTLFFGEHLYKMLLATEDFASGFVNIILEAVNGALKGLNWLIEGFNKLTGADISSIEMLVTPDMHILSDKLRAKLDGMEAPEEPDNLAHLNRLDYKDIAASFNQGNQAGKNLMNKGADALDSAKSKLGNNLKEMLPGSPGTEDAAQLGTGPGMNLPQIGSVGHVGSVDRINETVDISSEDLKMMRELAEVTAIQNFTTLTPTVTVNTGPVSKEVDIHTIVTQIEQVLEEEIATSAAGVYA